MNIVRARREKAFLRMGIAGQPKVGKSETSLLTMTGLLEYLAGIGELQGNGRICVIDTENESYKKYAMMHEDDIRPHAYDFDALVLTKPYSVERYVQAINEVEKQNYSGLIIDQITHCWRAEGGVLDVHNRLTDESKFKNSYTTWGKVRPKHDSFVERFLQFRGHLICTMRAKYKTTWDSDTKEVRKIGTRPIQEKNIGYEFDIMGMMTHDHSILFEGSRCQYVDNARFNCPGKELGVGIGEWLATGVTMTKSTKQKLPAQLAARIRKQAETMGLTEEDLLSSLTSRGVTVIEDLTERGALDMFQAMVDRWNEYKRKEEREARRQQATIQDASSAPPASPAPEAAVDLSQPEPAAVVAEMREFFGDSPDERKEVEAKQVKSTRARTTRNGARKK